MAGITLGFLKYVLGFDGGGFEQGLDEAQKQLRAAERSFRATADKIGEFGQNLTAAVTLPLVGIAAAGIAEAQATAAAMAQVNSALASMGPVAGRSAEQLSGLADQLELNSLAEADEILKSVTANLLTFGNIGGDVFDRTQQAVIDLSARMGTDLQSATILLGRALNDPVKGMTALARTGIQFTDSQKASVAAMAAMGDTAGAQGVILTELERQFGGAAAAAQNVDPWNKISDAFKQVAEQVGNVLLPLIPPITDAIVGLTQRFTELSPAAAQMVVIVGGIAAAVGPLAIGLGAVMHLIAPLVAALTVAGTAAGATAFSFGALAAAVLPFVAIAAGVAAAGYAIYQNWDKIAPVLQQVGEYVQAALGPTLIATFDQVKATVMELWNGPFGEGVTKVIEVLGILGAAFVQYFGPVLMAQLRGVMSVVGTVFEYIGNVLNVLGAILTGDWSSAWKYSVETVTDLVAGLGRLIEAVFPGAIGHVTALYNGVKLWLQDRLGAVFQWVQDKVKAVGDAFFWLYDAVVGNSYVPDMVTEIGEHMRRLQQTLVDPANAATQSAADAFKAMQQEVAGVFDRLFPEQARFNQYRRELALLEEYHRRVGTSIDMHQQALARLQNERDNVPLLADGDFELPAVPKIVAMTSAEMNRLGDIWAEQSGGLQVNNREILDSFIDMAYGVRDTLDRLSGAIKSGNILDIFSSILGALDQIGGMVGGFNFGGIDFGGARANGGPVSSGRTYLVGERGPEMFTPNMSGAIVSNDNMRGGGGPISLHVVGTDLFHVIARNEAGQVVAQSAPVIANAGSSMAQRDMAQRAKYQVAG